VLKHLCRIFAVDGEGPVGGDAPVNVEGTVGGDSYVELEQLVDAALRWWVSVGEQLNGVQFVVTLVGGGRT